MVTKDADGTWNEDLCTSGYVGYGGVGETTEWNRKTPKAWNSAEHIIEINPAYHYVLSLDYNPNCTPGGGSAIFLHCSTNRPTGGCISVPEDQMITILKNVQPGCQIIIDSANGLKNY